MSIFKNLFGSGGSPESGSSSQEQEQNQGQYKNIRPQQGTNGRLFLGDLINQEGIEGGGPTTHLLVPDGNG
jgi:hypothetical protein